MTSNIYLDVDGVINSFSKKPPKNDTGWKGEWLRGDAVVPNDYPTGGWSMGSSSQTFSIFWSVELIDSLNKISEMDDVNIIWLTTWKEHAKTVLSPLVGINGQEWVHLDAGDVYDTKDWWKLTAIREHVRETNPDRIIWLDDDLGFDYQARLWVNSLKNRILPITPNSNLGLTKKHISDILDFIK